MFQYYRATRNEREAEEYKTYNALDDKYIEFQRLCLQYPHLDVFDIPDKTPVALNEQEKKQELIAFSLLLSIFERAYLMYLPQNKKIKQEQWSGWDQYIREYCARANFREIVKSSAPTFDLRFESYIRAIIQDHEHSDKDTKN